MIELVAKKLGLGKSYATHNGDKSDEQLHDDLHKFIKQVFDEGVGGLNDIRCDVCGVQFIKE